MFNIFISRRNGCDMLCASYSSGERSLENALLVAFYFVLFFSFISKLYSSIFPFFFPFKYASMNWEAGHRPPSYHSRLVPQHIRIHGSALKPILLHFFFFMNFNSRFFKKKGMKFNQVQTHTTEISHNFSLYDVFEIEIGRK